MTQPTNETQALAEQILSRAIQEVVFKYNAFAPIVSAFRVAYTQSIPTIGVDRYARLVVNPEFLVENQTYANGLIIHEVLHVFFGHTTDARSRLAYSSTNLAHNQIANLAEDCAINQFITEGLPQGTINPNTLSHMLGTQVPTHQTAEQYYDLIMANLPPQQQQAGGGGMGAPSNMENPTCATGEANTQQVQDELDKMGIEHISQEEVSEKVLDTAVEMSKAQGNQYGSLAQFALEMLQPKVDWRPLLQATLRNAEKKVWTMHQRSTYKRTSRRSPYPVFLPKKYGHKIAVSLSFDTSGSISTDMVNQFLAEIRSCMQHSEIKECALWHTEVYWYGTPAQLTADIEKVFQSGGTDEHCMSDAEKHVKADLHIHFSDGYHGDNYGFEHPSKNIEIIYNNNEIKEIRRF